MSYQRDYVLRLIQMMGDLMRRLTEKLENRERMAMLDERSRELCGMPLAVAEELDAQSLIEMLLPLPRLVMSELLYMKAQTCELPIGDAEDLAYKTLRLLASLHGEPQLCDLRADRLQTLKQALFDQLTASELMNCARFFAQAERYDYMEDALFQALARETGAQWLTDREEGVAMLRRACAATQQTLALCNMTGSELRASAHELETQSTPHEQENPS